MIGWRKKKCYPTQPLYDLHLSNMWTSHVLHSWSANPQNVIQSPEKKNNSSWVPLVFKDSRKDGNIFEDWLLNFSGLDPHVISLRLQFSKILHGIWLFQPNTCLKFDKSVRRCIKHAAHLHNFPWHSNCLPSSIITNQLKQLSWDVHHLEVSDIMGATPKIIQVTRPWLSTNRHGDLGNPPIYWQPRLSSVVI